MTDMLLGIVNTLIFIVQWIVIPISITWWVAQKVSADFTGKDGSPEGFEIKKTVTTLVQAAVVGGILWWAVGAMKNVVPWIGSGINDTLDFGMILNTVPLYI